MAWKCGHCDSENGPESAYCPTCGEAGPEVSDADGAAASTRVQTAEASRTTLVGSSAGIAPSLFRLQADPALHQPLPRKVRLTVAGWTGLVGGWPELCVCMVALPLVAIAAYAMLVQILGGLGAAVASAGLALSLVFAMMAGAAETSRTLRTYRLVRSGWAASGEVFRKISRKGALGSTYFLEYLFVDARGVHRRGVQEVTHDQWREAVIHEFVTVLYDAHKPENSVIHGMLGVSAVLSPGASTGESAALPEPGVESAALPELGEE